jgi:pilus assembly protein Flp/PilA
MYNLKALIRKLTKKSEHGQGLVEYAMILFLVVVVVVAILVVLGPQVAGIFSKVTSSFAK